MGSTDTPTVSVTPSPGTEPEREGDAGLSPGDRVGRYTLEAELGRGGMAQVFLARDPELSREVALKLILPAGDPEERAEAQRRLLREAQALARLAHPNVVTVYDAGTHEDRVFIAMERVSGTTLRDWSREQERPWRESVSVMAAAGRGLAAAHQAELVHRDFKPTNVMLDDEGRVRVLDFGLAREASIDVVSPEDRSEGSNTEDSLKSALTRTGFVLGTPQYMAPEQFEGGLIDARTDQFSFCVALYQLVFGARPWADVEGKRPGQAAGRYPLEFPAVPVVPRALQVAIRRGLSLAPHERFPDMEALLAALPGSRRSRALPSAIAGLAAAGVAALLWPAENASVCADAGNAISEAWSDDHRQRVTRGLEGSGIPNADETVSRTLRALDGYAAAWSRMRTQACESASSSENALDLQMACLDRRRDELAALVALLSEADQAVAQRAIQAAMGLPALEECADVEGLQRAAPRPSDPEQLATLEQLEAQTAAVRALEIAGRYPEGRDRTLDLLRRARELGYEPLIADLEFQAGFFESVVGDAEVARAYLEEAVSRAQSAGADEIAAKALIQQVSLVGHGFSSTDEGLRIARHAESVVSRLGARPQLVGRLKANTATVHVRAGNLAEARVLYEEALEVTANAPSARLSHRAAQANLAVVHARLGEDERALELWFESLESLREQFGEEHPEYASALANIGVARFKLGRTEDARRDLGRAIEVYDAAGMGRSGKTAIAHHNLALTHAELDDFEPARQHYESALSIKRERNNPGNTSTAMTAGNLASLLVEMGRPEEAMGLASEAAASLRASLGTDNLVTAGVVAAYGKAQLAVGPPENAIASLDEALSIGLRTQMEPYEVAKLRLLLARALWDSQRDRTRAVELAREALTEVGTKPGRETRVRGEIEAWLAQRK